MFKNKLILSLIGVYIFWLVLFPVFISKALVRVCEKISFNSNYEVRISNPVVKLSVLPKTYFVADNINIRFKNDSANLELNGVLLELRLLPLLSGRFHVNDLSVDKASLSANLLKDLELDKNFIANFQNRNFRFNSIKIGEFVALFYQKELKTPIIYKGKDFRFNRTNRYIKLQNNSILDVAGNVSKVISNLYLPKNNDIRKTIFDVEIENVNIAPLRAYFKHYLPKDLLELKGIINISATKDGFITEFTDYALIMEEKARSIIFPSKMVINSKFNITRNFINFENIDIESKNIHATLEGRISDYFGNAMPTLDLNIRLNKSKLEDIVDMLPPFEIEELDVYRLKKYKFYADILANFSVKGRLPEPDVVGDIYINNGVLSKPIPNTEKGATIKLNMSGKHANFDVVVPTGGLEKVWVKGSQELYNIKYADLTVKSTEAVDLHVAQNVLEPLHEILNFIIGPVPIMDIKGKGNIDIHVRGNRKNPHIWGIFNVRNGEAYFNDIPDFVVKNADAVLKFIDQNVIFSSKKAIFNGKNFSINGNCDLFGKFDFQVLSNNQSTELLYKGVQTSTMFPEIKKLLPKIDSADGNIDLNLKIYGNVKDLNDLRFNENLFAKGEFILKDNVFQNQNIVVDKANGKVNFDNLNANAEITAKIGNLPLNIKGRVKNNLADLILDIPRLNPNFLISDEKTRNKQYLPYVSINGKYTGDLAKIDYSKLSLKAIILGSIPNSKIKYLSKGFVSISNNKIIIKDIKGFLENEKNTFDINLSVEEAFAQTPIVNGSIKVKSPDLKLFNEILTSDIIPEEIRKYTEDYKFLEGGLDLNAKIFNNKVNSFVDLSGISFVYLPFEMPIEIINGSLEFKNNILKLNKINLLADSMPVLVDGDIKDVFAKQNFNLYLNSKPQQEFIDKYINKNQIYPIKIKGDIVYWVRLKGIPENFDLKAEIDMSKDSSFYHFGATIGDIENAIEVSIDSKVVDGNKHKIREFSYDKVVDSQSGRQTRLNLLRAWGGVEILKEDLRFDNLHIKTSHPTDARIFNIIFRKPNIKQGQFTSDLKINGYLSNAKVLGDFHIFETNIPFLDTTMKNIELVFKDKTIDFDSKGDIMGNDVVFNGVLKNKLTIPYCVEKAYLYTKNLDLNEIVNKIKTAEVDSVSTFESFEKFDINSIIANNFKLKADNIKLRNIHATDFEAITSITEKGVFNVNDFIFNIAQGTLGGKYSYNLKTNDMGIKLKANNISANDISWALFDLNNQIYGDMTGDVNLTCQGADFNRCMETLSGNTVFTVKDGKMPKLGSLEYLLKAGNLLKGGLTGLSINSVIDLLAPSKTGDFSEIFGLVRIKDGVARNIEITTKGDDLSLFIGGTYNFATSIADMEVLGLLSRKISTMFGPIGNVSINTLFNVIPGVDLTKDSLVLERINKIPGIELSSKAYRKFIAEIKGNINGEDYVTSFKWIN